MDITSSYIINKNTIFYAIALILTVCRKIRCVLAANVSDDATHNLNPMRQPPGTLDQLLESVHFLDCSGRPKLASGRLLEMQRVLPPRQTCYVCKSGAAGGDPQARGKHPKTLQTAMFAQTPKRGWPQTAASDNVCIE